MAPVELRLSLPPVESERVPVKPLRLPERVVVVVVAPSVMLTVLLPLRVLAKVLPAAFNVNVPVAPMETAPERAPVEFTCSVPFEMVVPPV